MAEQNMAQTERDMFSYMMSSDFASQLDNQATTGVAPKLPTTTTQTQPTTYSLLKIGSRGDDVKRLQTTLNSLGYNTGTADGIYGSKTAAGVKAYQQAMGLTVDGLAGNQTLSSLYTQKTATPTPTPTPTPTNPTAGMSEAQKIALLESQGFVNPAAVPPPIPTPTAVTSPTNTAKDAFSAQMAEQFAREQADLQKIQADKANINPEWTAYQNFVKGYQGTQADADIAWARQHGSIPQQYGASTPVVAGTQSTATDSPTWENWVNFLKGYQGTTENAKREWAIKYGTLPPDQPSGATAQMAQTERDNFQYMMSDQFAKELDAQGSTVGSQAGTPTGEMAQAEKDMQSYMTSDEFAKQLDEQQRIAEGGFKQDGTPITPDFGRTGTGIGTTGTGTGVGTTGTGTTGVGGTGVGTGVVDTGKVTAGGQTSNDIFNEIQTGQFVYNSAADEQYRLSASNLENEIAQMMVGRGGLYSSVANNALQSGLMSLQINFRKAAYEEFIAERNFKLQMAQFLANREDEQFSRNMQIANYNLQVEQQKFTQWMQKQNLALSQAQFSFQKNQAALQQQIASQRNGLEMDIMKWQQDNDKYNDMKKLWFESQGGLANSKVAAYFGVKTNTPYSQGMIAFNDKQMDLINTKNSITNMAKQLEQADIVANAANGWYAEASKSYDVNKDSITVLGNENHQMTYRSSWNTMQTMMNTGTKPTELLDRMTKNYDAYVGQMGSLLAERLYNQVQAEVTLQTKRTFSDQWS